MLGTFRFGRCSLLPLEEAGGGDLAACGFGGLAAWVVVFVFCAVVCLVGCLLRKPMVENRCLAALVGLRSLLGFEFFQRWCLFSLMPFEEADGGEQVSRRVWV